MLSAISHYWVSRRRFKHSNGRAIRRIGHWPYIDNIGFLADAFDKSFSMNLRPLALFPHHTFDGDIE
ncbi:hypothetical protein [Photorhabdus sp. SF281]|uniref:hypothetical protein n=1 Tax=Photorhabdus sp. SF281 TaxID=3459527 RepID=UPI00404500DB